MKRSQTPAFTVPYVVWGLCAKPAKYSFMKSSLKCLRGYLATICSRNSAGNWSKPLSQHVEADARIEQRHFGLHVVSDARRGVQGNGFPDGSHLLFGNVVRAEELTRGIRAIDLEAFVFAGELLGQAEIVKGRGDVEEFRIEPQLALAALLGGEQIDPDRVIEEQIAGMLAQDARGLLGEKRIGNGEGGRENGHGSCFLREELRRRSGHKGTVASTIFPFGRGFRPSSIR